MLSSEARQRVAQAHGQHQDLRRLSRLAQFAVGNESLMTLFANLKLDHRFGVVAPGKAQADYMEAVVWELHVEREKKGGSRHAELVKETIDCILDALIIIGGDRMDRTDREGASNVPVIHRWDEELLWLKSFEAPLTEPYTHSSQYGCKDWCTGTGRLSFPDEPEVRFRLFAILSRRYDHDPRSCFCWVEMSTSHHPLIADIDVMGSQHVDDGPPDQLLLSSGLFWNMWAEILHTLFPSLPQLELTLFGASGWDRGKGRQKGSLHAVWNGLIVDRERANLVRQITLGSIQKKLAGSAWLRDMTEKLKRLDDRNDWEAIFDITAVRAGSFRMPFNDKVAKPRMKEGRPLLPVGVWTFDFTEHGEVNEARQTFYPNTLSTREWLERGSVRLLADTPGDLPLLTHFEPRLHLTQHLWPKLQPFSHSGSGACHLRNKLAKEKGKWLDEQRNRRFRFRGSAKEFKTKIDEQLGDAMGDESTLVQIQSKPRTTRWLWSNRRVRGAVEVQEPDGEVFIRGNLGQQLFLIQVVRDFADLWDGELPKAKRLFKLTRPSNADAHLQRAHGRHVAGGKKYCDPWWQQYHSTHDEARDRSNNRWQWRTHAWCGGNGPSGHHPDTAHELGSSRSSSRTRSIETRRRVGSPLQRQRWADLV